jgi:hypothetical protein
VGVGISGSLVTGPLSEKLGLLSGASPHDWELSGLAGQFKGNVESFFQPHILLRLPADVRESFQNAVGEAMTLVFGAVLTSSVLSLILCHLLPKMRKREKR